VVRRENLVAAYTRVVRNGWAAGVEGMTVDALAGHLRVHWSRIREAAEGTLPTATGGGWPISDGSK
jgi:hypothetical protein